jgi:hypothetical protein
LAAALLLAGGAGGQDRLPAPKGMKKDPGVVEEALVAKAAKAAGKAAEKGGPPGKTERDTWVKELGEAFPGKVGPGRTPEEVGQWFDLLASGRGTWDRDAAPKSAAKLHDRVSVRLYGRPGQPVRRDDFLAYARGYLDPAASPPWKSPELSAAKDADKLFAALDADGDGALVRAEWSDGLRAAGPAADRNRNGVIDRDEYRTYLTGRVAVAAEFPATTTASLTPAPGRNPPPRPAAAPPEKLPAWFAQLDADRDGQVGLYEWRKAGRPSAEFVAMDLNGDGLLPPDEYRRYARQSATAR